MNQKNERGVALLIELMIVCIVSTILMTAAVPSFMAIRRAQNQQLAEQQIRTIAAAENAVSLCAVNNCNAGQIAAVIPPDGTLKMFGYTFEMTHAGASYIYTATPTSPNQSGIFGFYVDQSGVVRCATTTATLTTPACAW